MSGKLEKTTDLMTTDRTGDRQLFKVQTRDKGKEHRLKCLVTLPSVNIVHHHRQHHYRNK